MAAPAATPAMAASEIGVSSTRSWPNSFSRPSVTVNAPPKPPGTPMSSPSRMTRSSLRISSRSASRSASTTVSRRSVVPCSSIVRGCVDIVQAILGFRARACFCECHGLIKLAFDILFHPLELFRRNQAFRFAEDLIAHQRVSPAPILYLLLGAIVPRVAAGVSGEPVGLQFEQRGTTARTRSFRGFRHSVVDHFHVVAVHGAARNSICRAARAAPRHTGHFLNGGGCSVAVVLADEDDGKIPYRRDIHSLVEGPDVGGAIAEKAAHNISRLALLHGQRITGSERNSAAYDCNRRKHAIVEVAHVHGSAFASAAAGRFGIQFGHQALDWNAARYRVLMRPMRACDHVARAKRRAYSYGSGLLALRLVDCPGHSALQKQVVDAIFEHPAQQHAAQHRQALLAGDS